MAKKTDLGIVQIRNEVIGTIASLAAQEVEGVLGVWRGPLSIGPWFGNSGVRVETVDQEVRLWLKLIVQYGVSLPQVAAQVQERVHDMIERMTHLTATEVHVSIHHVKPKRSQTK